jgi:hypothetical protein
MYPARFQRGIHLGEDRGDDGLNGRGMRGGAGHVETTLDVTKN